MSLRWLDSTLSHFRHLLPLSHNLLFPLQSPPFEFCAICLKWISAVANCFNVTVPKEGEKKVDSVIVCQGAKSYSVKTLDFNIQQY